MSKKSSVLLDVDPNIFERNLLIKDDTESGDSDLFENYLKTQLSEQDDAPWKIVKPTPGICIKTTDTNNKKVFINLCKVDEIPEPQEITEEELAKIWQSDDSYNYRVPISIQEPREELDKSGHMTTAYDVAVNSKFFEKVESSLLFRGFVIQLVIEGVENKYDVSLNKDDYIILKNRKCLGELTPHRIRSQKGPYQPPKRLIEEISSKSSREEVERSEGESEKRANIVSKNVEETPNYRLFCREPETMIGEFHLPNVLSDKDIRLDVGEDRIVLECRRGGYLVDVFVPHNIDQDITRATFSQDTKLLTVTMPLIAPAY